MYELDKLPYYELETMYYAFFKEKEAESKLTEKQKAANAVGRMIEDNV